MRGWNPLTALDVAAHPCFVLMICSRRKPFLTKGYCKEAATKLLADASWSFKRLGGTIKNERPGGGWKTTQRQNQNLLECSCELDNKHARCFVHTAAYFFTQRGVIKASPSSSCLRSSMRFILFERQKAWDQCDVSLGACQNCVDLFPLRRPHDSRCRHNAA